MFDVAAELSCQTIKQIMALQWFKIALKNKCKQYGCSSKKLNIELPCGPAILLLGIYSKELKAGTQADTCTPMFITALFIIAKRQKQLKSPLTYEWKKKMYIHTMECYVALKMF